MHAKYVTTTTPTLAQVIADLAALACGGSIASLSASCDKANSTLVSTVVPGWTLVDAAAANSGQVVSAADANTLTTKYVRIFAPNVSAIDLACYEGWNATTHVGSNGSTATGRTLAYTAGAVNTYWLFATARTLYLLASGNITLGVLEVSRDAAYLAGSTYPVAAVISDGGLIAGNVSSISRVKKMAATGDSTGGSAQVIGACSLGARGATTTAYVPNATLRDGSETAYYELRPIWLGITGDVGTLPRPAILGKLYDVFELAGAAGNQFDTFSDGTDTYLVAYVSAAAAAFAFKVA